MHNNVFGLPSDQHVLLSALNIKLLEPLAQGASRFEKSLAPQKSTGPQFFSNDVRNRRRHKNIEIISQ